MATSGKNSRVVAELERFFSPGNPGYGKQYTALALATRLRFSENSIRGAITALTKKGWTDTTDDDPELGRFHRLTPPLDKRVAA
jgi:hypothetical protein